MTARASRARAIEAAKRCDGCRWWERTSVGPYSLRFRRCAELSSGVKIETPNGEKDDFYTAPEFYCAQFKERG